MTDLFGNPDPVERKLVHPDPCRHCGSHHFRVEPGKGPHAALLRCFVCGRGTRWLSKVEAEQLKEAE